MKKKNLLAKRIPVIIFAILYSVIGVSELIQGANEESRFFFYDNIIIRVLGCLFIISSIGLVFRKKIAYKLWIITALISLVEAIITFNTTGFSKTDIIAIYSIMLITYLVPVIVLLIPGVKDYFCKVQDDNFRDDYLDDTSEKNNIELPESKLGIASFILSIISLLFLVISVLILLKFPINQIRLNISTPQLIAIAILLISILTNFIGLGLSILGAISKKRKKVFCILGAIFNFLIALFYVSVIITAISIINNEQKQYQFVISNFIKYLYI